MELESSTPPKISSFFCPPQLFFIGEVHWFHILLFSPLLLTNSNYNSCFSPLTRKFVKPYAEYFHFSKGNKYFLGLCFLKYSVDRYSNTLFVILWNYKPHFGVVAWREMQSLYRFMVLKLELSKASWAKIGNKYVYGYLIVGTTCVSDASAS